MIEKISQETVNALTDIFDFDKLKQLRLEMNRIGVNVNQIAKRVNENGEADSEEVIECLALLNELKELTNTLIKSQLKEGT
ncbi:TPA: plasmid mobilization relaxosome protein MobC [Streptococcus suis]|nr:plasmid mobilization relaxosome protein MobC [Streptococcus suis]